VGLKVWNVNVPATVNIAFSVEGAETEEEALSLALNADVHLTAKVAPDAMRPGGRVAEGWVEEWSMHQEVVEGNVFHGVLNEASAELDYEEGGNGDED